MENTVQEIRIQAPAEYRSRDGKRAARTISFVKDEPSNQEKVVYRLHGQPLWRVTTLNAFANEWEQVVEEIPQPEERVVTVEKVAGQIPSASNYYQSEEYRRLLETQGRAPEIESRGGPAEQ